MKSNPPIYAPAIIFSIAFCRARLAVLGIALVFLPCYASAHIVTDGTVGTSLSLDGPDYQIAEYLGSRVGGNLFHSFERFEIEKNERATFTGSDDIARVISRVTGGRQSTIDGLLRSAVGKADFYFINPAGVIFTDNAQVDVPAAFHVSTAEMLHFTDGAVFSATNPDHSTLTMSPPKAFGFLSPKPAGITVNGSVLKFAPQSTVSMSGGDVTITGTRTKKSSIVSEGGTIRLTAVGNKSGQVPVGGEPALNAKGHVDIGKTNISSGGDGGGRVIIESGESELSACRIDADNTGTADAESGIDLVANGLLTMSDQVILSARAVSSGDAGDIRINADRMRAERGVEISSGTSSEGDSGKVELSVSECMDLYGNILISTATGATIENNLAVGNAGAVRVKTGKLNICGTDSGFASICSHSRSRGDAGTVEISVNGPLRVQSGAVFSSDAFGAGNGGKIRIEAQELIASALWITGTSYWEGSNPGEIEVRVQDRLHLLDESSINSINWGGGKEPGSVSVTAGELIVEGEGTFRRSVYSNIGTEAYRGDSGTVEVVVDGLLELKEGADISSSSTDGNAGQVFVKAGRLKADNSVIASDSSGENAGKVRVSVSGLLELYGQARISTDTYWGGQNAGKVEIEAEELLIDGKNESGFTGIGSRADAGSYGHVGDIFIDADTVSVVNNGKISIIAMQLQPQNVVKDMRHPSISLNTRRLLLNKGAGISAESTGVVPASEISIRTVALIVEGGSRITTSSIEADGGPITVEGHGLLLKNGLITTSLEGVSGDGGNIVIRAGALGLQGGFIQANTAAAGARGGDILVDTRSVIVDGELEVGGSERREFRSARDISIIQAAAPGGEEGVIVIVVPELDISGSLVPVSADLEARVRLATDPCETFYGEPASSLVVEGRGGLPRGLHAPASVFFGKERLSPENPAGSRKETESDE